MLYEGFIALLRKDVSHQPVAPFPSENAGKLAKKQPVGMISFFFFYVFLFFFSTRLSG